MNKQLKNLAKKRGKAKMRAYQLKEKFLEKNGHINNIVPIYLDTDISRTWLCCDTRAWKISWVSAGNNEVCSAGEAVWRGFSLARGTGLNRLAEMTFTNARTHGVLFLWRALFEVMLICVASKQAPPIQVSKLKCLDWNAKPSRSHK
jgi:hypothetical protein